MYNHDCVAVSNQICKCGSDKWVMLPSGIEVCRDCGRPAPPDPDPKTPRP